MKLKRFQFFIILVLPQLAKSIFHGRFVSIEEVPWFVALIDEDEMVGCGGTIISDSWVITAAHCIDFETNFPTKIRSGTNLQDGRGNVFQINKTIIHKDYKLYNDEQTWAEADIALIKLNRSITFDEYQKPLKISSYPPKAGDEIDLYGMGDVQIFTDSDKIINIQPVLKKATMTVLDSDDCNKLLPFGRVTNSSFCGGDYITTLLLGDSGGGALINGKLVGIVSWNVGDSINAFPHNCQSLPSIFTRVYLFRDWIYNQTKIHL